MLEQAGTQLEILRHDEEAEEEVCDISEKDSVTESLPPGGGRARVMAGSWSQAGSWRQVGSWRQTGSWRQAGSWRS
jgi:hypothetical protein